MRYDDIEKDNFREAYRNRENTHYTFLMQAVVDVCNELCLAIDLTFGLQSGSLQDCF